MFKYRAFFDIHYQTSLGEFLVVVGNCAELGQWNVSKGVRMRFTQGDVWKATTLIHHSCQENCEYKYVVCRSGKIPNEFEILRWEEGPNRLITFKSLKKLSFSLKDVWGMRKLCFRIPNNLENESQVLKISGDIPQMGCLVDSFEMRKVYKKEKNSECKEQFWELEFIVDPMEKYISYFYFAYDKETTEIVYERKKFRRVCVDYFPSNEVFAANGFLDRSQTLTKFATLKNDRYKISDFDFQYKFLFNRINKNIILGPCPQNKDEVELLNKNGVKAIMNLQRDEDMERMGINWITMKQIYASKGIEVINYQIKDQSPDKIGQKIVYAAYILKEMIDKFEKVYVHCTLGKIRSPYTVMVYLSLYKGVPVNEVIETMKIKRPIALAKKNMLIKIIEFSRHISPTVFMFRL